MGAIQSGIYQYWKKKRITKLSITKVYILLPYSWSQIENSEAAHQVHEDADIRVEVTNSLYTRSMRMLISEWRSLTASMGTHHSPCRQGSVGSRESTFRWFCDASYLVRHNDWTVYFRYLRIIWSNMWMRPPCLVHLVRCSCMNGPSWDMECLRSTATLGIPSIPCSTPNKYSLLRDPEMLWSQTFVPMLNLQVCWPSCKEVAT